MIPVFFLHTGCCQPTVTAWFVRLDFLIRSGYFEVAAPPQRSQPQSVWSTFHQRPPACPLVSTVAALSTDYADIAASCHCPEMCPHQCALVWFGCTWERCMHSRDYNFWFCPTGTQESTANILFRTVISGCNWLYLIKRNCCAGLSLISLGFKWGS